MQGSTRRSFGKKMLPLALGSVCMSMLARCMPKKSSNTPSPSPQPDSENTPKGATENAADPSQDSGVDKGAERAVVPRQSGLDSAFKDACPSNESKVDLAKLQQAPEALEAKFVCYGTRASALLAFSLPKYQHGQLRDVYVCDQDGRLLAQCAVWEASAVRDDNTLRPLLFEQLQLSAVTSLALVFRMKDERYFRYTFSEPLSFVSEFSGKKVEGLNAVSTLDPAAFLAQAPSVFVSQISSWQASLDLEATLEPDSKTKFSANPGLAGFVVTDIMGEVLAQDGAGFTAVYDHDILVCYRLGAQGKYARSLVKVL